MKAAQGGSARRRRLRVDGVLFETGDVLYDASAWRRWLFQLLAHMGLRTHFEAFFSLWEHEHLRDVHLGRRDYWDAMRDFLRSSGLTSGQADEVIAAGRAKRRELCDQARVLPGVRRTIARLSERGIGLGVLSNSAWPRRDLERRLSSLGMSGRFQCVLSSRDLGCVMPEAGCYRAALDEMRLAERNVAFVSRDQLDLWGAKSAGMLTIALDCPGPVDVDYALTRFDELERVLAAPARQRAA